MSSVRHCSRSLHLASFKNKFTSSVFARSSFLCCASAVAQQAERAQRRRRSKSAGASTPPSDMYMPVPCSGWVSLGVPRRELSLCFTLPTGQSFRWRETVPDVEYTGVIGQRLVCMRQEEEDVLYRVLARGQGADAAHDDQVIRDYFNLSHSTSQGVCLSGLADGWAKQCSRFRAVQPYFPGARMLRQDPVECLFQFICSSNNHISRIHGMVERLCSRYGTPLVPESMQAGPCVAEAASGLEAEGVMKLEEAGAPGTPSRVLGAGSVDGIATAAEALVTPAIHNTWQGPPSPKGPGGRSRKAAGIKKEEAVEEDGPGQLQGAGQPTGQEAGRSSPGFYAFPTLQQLSAATEEELRADGFGYRAKFIVGSVALLLAKPEGGETWLLGLRQQPFEEAVEHLSTLPGVGPKVAACIALFSLDKHESIPVDTHVWQIATRYYLPSLRGKALTKKVHGEVQQAFTKRFGPYAGWAHNTLFISELASQAHRLPPQLQAAAGGSGKGGRGRGRGRGKVGDSSSASEAEEGEEEEEAAGVGDAGARTAGQVEGQGAAAGGGSGAGGAAQADSQCKRAKSRRLDL